jgi:16S rRNA (cytosine967-C5)-methyltransferase
MKKEERKYSKKISPREQAFLSLLAIDREGAFSNLEIKKVLSRSLFSKPDMHLYTALVYGVLQNELYLDHQIKKMLKSRTSLDFKVRELLRIGTYQLLMMDRIPDYAVISETVDLCKKYCSRAKGFVNGVLRNMARQKQQLKNWSWSDYENSLQALSIRASVPREILDVYLQVFGTKKGVQILMQMNQPSPLTLRVNRLKTTREELIRLLEADGIESEKTLLSQEGIRVKNTSVTELSGTQAYQTGLFTIQDQGAMLIAEALDPKAGEQVLDMCAAPGGKTTYFAEMMGNCGQIVARDLYPSRLKLIDTQAALLGVTIIRTEVGDSTKLDVKDRGHYDRVLLDAPCSGLGIIRRKPEIRYRFNRKEQKTLIQIQRKMLLNAVEALKPGGTLVYSTCTVDPKENSEQVQWLIQNSKNMKIEMTRQISLLDDRCDGFFIAKLRKTAQD